MTVTDFYIHTQRNLRILEEKVFDLKIDKSKCRFISTASYTQGKLYADFLRIQKTRRIEPFNIY